MKTEKPLVRACCSCEKPLDERSKIIMETRERCEYDISHGFCKPCEEDYIRQYKSP